MVASGNENTSHTLWQAGRQACHAVLYTPLLIAALSPVISGCTVEKKIAARSLANKPEPKIITIQKHGVQDDILYEAAKDGVITDQEIAGYGSSLKSLPCHFGDIPDSVAERDIYRTQLKAGYVVDMAALLGYLHGHHYSYVHYDVEQNKKCKRQDVYLSRQQLDTYYTYCRTSAQNLGLDKVNFYLANTRSSSYYNKKSHTVGFNIREEFCVSDEFFYFTVGHELGHAYQSTYQPLSADPVRRKSRLNDDQYNRKYHTEENRSDSLAVTFTPYPIAPSHILEGAYALFIGNKQRSSTEFAENLKQAAKADDSDVHAPNLERFKRMMLIAGRQFRP